MFHKHSSLTNTFLKGEEYHLLVGLMRNYTVCKIERRFQESPGTPRKGDTGTKKSVNLKT